MTDDELDQARRCPKRRIASTRPKAKQAFMEQQFTLEDAQGRLYRLFKLWQPERRGFFSVGLALRGAPDDLVLCRYNGRFHGHGNRLERTRFPAQMHIHTATARYIDAGLDADGFAAPTNRYEDVDSALRCLVLDCNIEGLLPASAGDPTPDLFDDPA